MTGVRKYSVPATRELIWKWCDRGERSHQDVRHKLMRWNVPEAEREGLIADLVAENLLNEERYAVAFASDHFRFRNWGSRKIVAALKRKGVSERNIRKAISLIPAEDGMASARHVLEKYITRVSELSPAKKRARSIRYLLGKGFTSEEAWNAINQLFGGDDTRVAG